MPSFVDYTLFHCLRWLPILQYSSADFALLVNVGMIHRRGELDLMYHSIRVLASVVKTQ